MQKKRIAAISLFLALMLSIVASAAPAPRYNSTSKCNILLSFSGTTAYCEFLIDADRGTDISATMRLYRIDGEYVTLLKTWPTKSGTTSLSYLGTYSVSRGEEYILTLDVTADGPGGVDYINKTATNMYL